MKIIGITGGVGSGKTEILNYLRSHYNCRVIIADEAAHELERRGGACYDALTALLGKDILGADGEIDRGRMAAAIFGDRELLAQVNGIVHPAVRQYIADVIRQERAAGQTDYLFLESALLIENGYDRTMDEMWYIRTEEKARRERLRQSRGYTEAKTDSIMRRQLSEEEYGRHCTVVIDNSGSLQDTYRQIEQKLGKGSCQEL